MIYVFPQFVALYRTVCNTEEKFDRVYLFDEHVNSSIVEFDEELLEHGDSERGYFDEDDAPLCGIHTYFQRVIRHKVRIQ